VKTKHLIDIIGVELDDLVTDLVDTEGVLIRRLQEESITDYVYKENNALLRREAMAIKGLKDLTGDFLPSDYPNPKDCAQAFMEKVKAEVDHLQSPQAVVAMVDRRVQKALKFVLDAE
jgi:hypothetical protein